MLCTFLVEVQQSVVRGHGFTINSDHFAMSHLQRDIFRFVRRLLRIDGPHPAIFVWRIPCAFQNATFGRNVPCVGITRVDLG
ncbi:Uncharacterised protein [Vibrio cholerae]|nr:Uncharacterised protein [Vibrio cholerae]CSI64004.1 Uncharacterised protein [Vibrio cholerae]